MCRGTIDLINLRPQIKCQPATLKGKIHGFGWIVCPSLVNTRPVCAVQVTYSPPLYHSISQPDLLKPIFLPH